MTSQAIIKSEMTDQAKAEKHFREVLNRGEGRADVLAVIAEQPSAALARLNDTKALTDRGAADILDEIVGQVPDGDRARELLEQELPPERLRQLLLARGDLPSSAAYVVSLEDIVRVVLADMEELMKSEDEDGKRVRVIERESSSNHLSLKEVPDPENDDQFDDEPDSKAISLDIDSPGPLYVLLGWAHKLKDRSDYQEFLQTGLGNYTVLQCILLALWHDAGCPDAESGDDQVSGMAVDELNLDVTEAREALHELFAYGPPVFSRAEIEDARQNLSRRRKAQAAAPTMVDEARDAAEQAKDELDF